MNRSKDQKKLIKFCAIYTPVMILAYAVFSLIKGSFDWTGILGYTCGTLVAGIIMAIFYVLGSHQPKQ